MADSCATGYQPNFPGSSSWVTAVGATQGVESGTTETVCMSNFGGTITGGGGFSTYSTLPVWQATQVPSPSDAGPVYTYPVVRASALSGSFLGPHLRPCGDPYPGPCLGPYLGPYLGNYLGPCGDHH
jgi:hypothetical protein